MPKIVCPYCFEEFNRSEVMFRCTNDDCEKLMDLKLSHFWGQDRKMLPFVENQLGWVAKKLDSMPDSADCPRCGGGVAQSRGLSPRSLLSEKEVPRGNGRRL